MKKNNNIWLSELDCSIDDFKECVEAQLQSSDVPLATELVSNIPVYDGNEIRRHLQDRKQLQGYMQEWNNNFLNGSGVIVIRQGFSHTQLIDDVSDVLNTIIDQEESATSSSGDHFAPAGSNSRLWNAHEKLAVQSPKLYIQYNSNPIIALASRSWLGPLYQITAQVNLVRPGGKAQNPHRDYHLGFVSKKHLYDFPKVVHSLSAALTLQAGIAHSDMPVETGPTKLLPFSQRYLPGYIAIHLPEFSKYFENNYVQIALNKGDMIFFNPATFHAAGENRTTDTHRFANLLQIGSGFGRSIETVDTARICRTIYSDLLAMKNNDTISNQEMENVIAASAEGYQFPTNLDLDSPTDSMVPMSEQDLLRTALHDNWTEQQLTDALQAQAARRLSVG